MENRFDDSYSIDTYLCTSFKFTTCERRLLVEYVSKIIFWTLVSVICFFLLKRWMRYRKILQELNKLPIVRINFFTDLILWVFQTYSKQRKYPASVYYFERIISLGILNAKEGIFVIWFGYHPLVFVFRADLVKSLLTSTAASLKSAEYKFLRSWVGLGLLTSNGDRWKCRRKILTPSFDFRILENSLSVFNEQSMILVNKFQSFKGSECVSITPHIFCCALDIICDSAMGVHIDAQRNSESEYLKATSQAMDAVIRRGAQMWNWSDFIFFASSEGRKFKKNVNILHKFTEKVIKQRKEAMIKKAAELKNVEKQDFTFNDIGRKPTEKKPFLDTLLDVHLNQQLLSEGDIRDEVNTFMAAGYDTTAVSITWALYCIGLYPDIQTKLMEEMDYIFDGDKERPVSLGDLAEMKYLECTLKETQRVYPTASIIGRRITDDIQINGMTIPKEAAIYCLTYMLHRDPKEFPDPEIFDPDRFLPEVARNRHPYAFLPFGAGPRNCIGQKFAMMEDKVVIANILRHFQIVSLDPRDKLPFGLEITLKPGKAVRMKLIPREAS